MKRLALCVTAMLALGGLAAVAQFPAGPAPQGGMPGAPGEAPRSGAVPGNAGAIAEAIEPREVPRSARDPFWPVGYVLPPPTVKSSGGASAPGAGGSAAPAVAAVTRPPDWDEARRRLDIKGISRIGRDRTTGRDMYFVDVNGRIAENGDTVSATWDGRVYRWRITQVSPAGLQLQKLDHRAE